MTKPEETVVLLFSSPPPNYNNVKFISFLYESHVAKLCLCRYDALTPWSEIIFIQALLGRPHRRN